MCETMVFQETGRTAHGYLWLGGLTVMILFLGYVFWYDHRKAANKKFWSEHFTKAGLTKDQITEMKHDGDVWYSSPEGRCADAQSETSPSGERGQNSTCVGYGDWNEECPGFESFCAGGKTFGDADKQAMAVSAALKNGGKHPECPIIY